MAVPIVMPRLGDFMTEGVVAKWARSSGEQVNQGDVLAEIESEKLNYDLEATESGVLHTAVKEGDVVPVDGLIGYLLAEGEEPPAAPAESPPAPAAAAPSAPGPGAPQPSPGDTVPSTPGARRLAASLGVDISQVSPTGPRGRVVEADVRSFAESRSAAPASSPPAPAQAPPAFALPPGLPDAARTAPLQGMRRAIARHMKDSLAGTAQLSYFLEVDVTEAQRLRREASRGGSDNIALVHVLVKACAEALRRVPALNSVLAGEEIRYFDTVNMGMAVALDEGLIVPVIKDVGRKSISEIASEASELADKARRGGLSSNDVVGSTFTISVLGIVDGFTPILNAGNTGIVGVGRSVEKPVVRDGQVVVREVMTLSLTADHQVADGATAAAFMRRLQQAVERPGPLFA